MSAWIRVPSGGTLESEMPVRRIMLSLLVLTAVNCGADSKPDAEPATLQTDRGAVEFERLRCIYRQTTGAVEDLELQLQWLATETTVAYALYTDGLTPATPFSVDAGDTSRSFRFEVFIEGAGYSDSLSDGEIGIELSSLPAPATLVDGETVELDGALVVKEDLLLNDQSDTVGSIIVEAQRVPFSCADPFSVSVAENGDPGI